MIKTDIWDNFLMSFVWIILIFLIQNPQLKYSLYHTETIFFYNYMDLRGQGA